MYENKYKNVSASGTKDLDRFLNILADLDTGIELFAIGGTAMVLKGIKEATKDIDFMTTCSQDLLRELLERAGLREESPSGACNIWYLDRIRIDIFYGPAIMGVPLPPDWKELSEHVRDVGKVRLFILDGYDVIITKLARSEERDYSDAIAIMHHQKMDLEMLKSRYYGLAEESLIADYDYKFRHLERLLRRR